MTPEQLDSKVAAFLRQGGAITNIQLLCPTCNLRKNAKSPEAWAKENGKLI